MKPKGKLLIVDDEPLILKNLRLTLQDYVEEIVVAGNGLEALEALKKTGVDCVICDINMPKMNGVELLRKLRSDGNEVPVIFYTGHGNRELMIEAAKLGAFDFLDKPDLDGLEEVVSKGLQKNFEKNAQRPSDEDQLSSYRKLLQELEDS